MHGIGVEKNTPRLSGVMWSIDHLVLGDQILWLGRLQVWLLESCFECEDVFFENALLNELFQVLSEDVLASESRWLSHATASVSFICFFIP